MNRKTAVVIFILVLVISFVAYTAMQNAWVNEQAPHEQPPTELRVFVAASLTNITQKHQETFETENNAKIIFNFGGSDTLYQQIESGSPADVFMAADFKWTKKLQAEGLLYNNEYWNFTTNMLVVILPADNPAHITDLSQLARPGTRIIVAAWTVPVGKYTNVTLTKIQNTWGEESSPNYKGEEWTNFREKVVSNIISYETNVGSVVSKVSMGICDAGFCYVTDAISHTELKSVAIPAEASTVGTYGIAVLNSTQHELAARYVNFWISNEGQQLLADYGFGAENLMMIYYDGQVRPVDTKTILVLDPIRSYRFNCIVSTAS